jgi:predicted Zn-dependent protease
MLMELGRLAEAEAMARRGVGSNPKSATAYWNLAEAQVAQQRFAAAESTLTLISERLPENPYRYWVKLSIPLADATSMRSTRI